MLALLALLLAMSGCFLLDSAEGVRGAGGPFPDGDDDDDWGTPPLQSGTYDLVESSVAPMECAIWTSAWLAQFSTVDVSPNVSSVDLLFEDADGNYYAPTYDVSGSMLENLDYPPWSEPLDFADPTIYEFFGMSTSADCGTRQRV